MSGKVWANAKIDQFEQIMFSIHDKQNPDFHPISISGVEVSASQRSDFGFLANCSQVAAGAKNMT